MLLRRSKLSGAMQPGSRKRNHRRPPFRLRFLHRLLKHQMERELVHPTVLLRENRGNGIGKRRNRLSLCCLPTSHHLQLQCTTLWAGHQRPNECDTRWSIGPSITLRLLWVDGTNEPSLQRSRKTNCIGRPGPFMNWVLWIWRRS